MKKIIRNTFTEEGKAFWDAAKKSAEGVREWPDWKKAGVAYEPPGSPPKMAPEEQAAFWAAAAEARKEIATWPEWKRKAAEALLRCTDPK